VLCAADEVAVGLFLSRRIGLTDIARIVQSTLEQHQNVPQPSLDEILAADAWARECATRLSVDNYNEPERSSNPERDN
jgi:1-deoxy-D-xylulose-5-phosphate reductoisomerase